MIKVNENENVISLIENFPRNIPSNFGFLKRFIDEFTCTGIEVEILYACLRNGELILAKMLIKSHCQFIRRIVSISVKLSKK